MRRAFLRIVAVVGKCCFRCADGEAMPAIIKFVAPEKKPAAPIPSSKRPALAVALLDLPLEFRCSAIGGDAFSAERPVLVFCGNFKGVSKSEKQRSGPPFDDSALGRSVPAEQKELAGFERAALRNDSVP